MFKKIRLAKLKKEIERSFQWETEFIREKYVNKEIDVKEFHIEMQKCFSKLDQRLTALQGA